MKKFLSIISSLVMIFSGAYIFYLILSGSYPNFLNPKFVWLTGSCGALLILMGIVTLFIRLSVKISAVIIMILFVIICLLAPAVRLHGEELNKINPSDPAWQIRPELHSTKVTINGNDYIPINIAEMYMILYNNPPKKVNEIIKKNNYVFRGFIYRNQKLEKLGQFAVMRVAMSCCIADAVALGFRIKTEDEANYKNDDWVRVYGHLEKFKPDKLEETVDISGIANTDLKNDFMFIADKLEPDREPQSPFIVEWKEKAPFAY
jgi:uncharacterized repeat protein (TIGR03943 family)